MQQTIHSAPATFLVKAPESLKLLDQRRLPHTVDYVLCQRGEEVAVAIRDMVVRGAPLIGIVAAYGLALESKRAGDAGHFARVAQLLRQARPTAVNLAWAVERMQRAHAAGEDLWQVAATIASQDLAMNHAIGGHGAALMPNQGSILTHCNAGYLATGGWGTALGVIRSAVQQGKTLHVWVDETRPYLQGSRLTAWELMQDQIDCTLICDNMAGTLMAKGKVDAILVGADRIAANGDVANKIGTYGLAVMAKAHSIPMYVAAPSSTIDLKCDRGEAIIIEARAAIELTHLGNQALAPTGVKVFNPAFDVTPAALVSAIITERGVARPPYASALSSHSSINLG